MGGALAASSCLVREMRKIQTFKISFAPPSTVHLRQIQAWEEGIQNPLNFVDVVYGYTRYRL